MTTRVGTSRVSPYGNEEVSGEELVKEAREDGNIDEEDFGILLTSTDFKFKSLVEGLEDEINSEWMGGTTVAEIKEEGPSEETAVFMLIESDEIDFDVVNSEKITGNAEEASKTAVERINDFSDQDRNQLLFTLIPGLTLEKDGREFKFLKGLEKTLEQDIEVVGGSTGDTHSIKENYQFKNGEIYADRAVMTIIKTDLEIKTGQAHGFEKEVKTGVVNEADGRWLEKVNGKPALEFYSEASGVSEKELSKIFDLSLKDQLKAGVLYLKLKLEGKNPSMIHNILKHSLDYSIAREISKDNYQIISPLEVKGDKIKLTDKVREGQAIKVLEGDKESIIEAGNNAFSHVNSEDALFGVVADCANRHILLEESEREQEVEKTADKLGDNFIGFYGEGEIGGGETGMCTYISQTVTGFVVERPD